MPAQSRFLAVAALVVAACTATSGAGTTTSGATGDATGRLVVVDESGNVVTIDPDGSHRRALTDDADPTTRYFQPIWSPDSSMIAWSEGRVSGSGIALSGDDDRGTRTVPTSMFPFYLSWSPDGSHIGALHNGPPGSIDFEIVDVGRLTSEVVDRGSPYYFSWNPQGEGLLSHARGDTLAKIGIDGRIEGVGQTSANYAAPVWAASGLFFVGEEGVIQQPDDGDRHVVATADGFVSIVANDGGSLLAVQVLTTGDGGGLTVSLQTTERLTPNVVNVVDVASGRIDVISERPSLGSFWSPDGSKLVMLIPTDSEGGVDVVVWESGEVATLAEVTLPLSLIGEALQFFDQYAQSWEIWSPDSGSIVLSGTIDGESGIWVLSLDGSRPEHVAGGTWAAWSHG